MKNLPSNKIILITVLSVIIYVIVDFQIKGRNNFFQLNYDWNSLSTIEKHKGFKIDSLSYDFLSLSSETKSHSINFNIYNTYALNDKYYFRSSSISKKDLKIEFRGLYWINIKPEIDENIHEISIVDLEIKQQGLNSVCMIGDSQLAWLDLKYIRRDISQKLKNINFVGNYSDVFGYKYCVKLLNNSESILKEIDSIPKSDTYVFFIGAHENDVKESIKNIKAILNKLLSFKSKIILISPPDYLKPDLVIVKNEIKSLFLDFKLNSNISIINLDNLLINKNKMLMDDGVHLNNTGREILTNNLIKALR